MSKFKGTKGEWKATLGADPTEVKVNNNEVCLVAIQDYDNKDIEQYSNAQLIADAGNVRQQINCSLTELLKQRNELLEALQTTLANYKRQLHINDRDDINNCIPLAEKAIKNTTT